MTLSHSRVLMFVQRGYILIAPFNPFNQVDGYAFMISNEKATTLSI